MNKETTTLPHGNSNSSGNGYGNSDENDRVPDEFICPLTLEIMVSPVMTRTGHSFERSAILAWLQRTGQCPLTRKQMKLRDLAPNHALASRIQQWKKEHHVVDDTSEVSDSNTNEYHLEDLWLCPAIPTSKTSVSTTKESRNTGPRSLVSLFSRAGFTKRKWSLPFRKEES
jgi:hypothetical protein